MRQAHAGWVIGPSEAAKEHFDILIVDEAHRLRQRKNITNFASFDETNARLGFDKHEGNELDWILKMSTFQVLFYDEGQSIKPSDINKEVFSKKKWSAKLVRLQSQLRFKGGADYISFVDNLLHGSSATCIPFDNSNYELKLFDSLADLYTALREKED